MHSPVDPRKLVLAGDSAGGGLCLTALTIIRDLGLPMPAGAILISPWVDLTHSFPSVMENVKKVDLQEKTRVSFLNMATGYHTRLRFRLQTLSNLASRSSSRRWQKSCTN